MLRRFALLVACAAVCTGFCTPSTPLGAKALLKQAAPSSPPLATSRMGLRRPRVAAAGLNMQFGGLFGGKKTVSPEEAGLIPDIFPAGTEMGSSDILCKYPAWVKSAMAMGDIFSFGDTPTKGAGQINAGDTMLPVQAQDRPTLGWDGEAGAYYTVIMTNPDAPSAKDPSQREWVHWVRGNVPGDNLPCDGEDGGDDIKEYVGAGPMEGAGVQRYFIMVFKQQGKVDFEGKDRVPFTESERPGFKTAEFAEKYELGTPIGFTYFKAEYDNYVPELYAKLKGDIKD
mmetsp:Transcript_15131/g.37901  ORF Transcript_15131/g.37901 Transcript_15131/m.37901 type:complete len:285 (-) Transcript_15131:351-1205(-)